MRSQNHVPSLKHKTWQVSVTKGANLNHSRNQSRFFLESSTCTQFLKKKREYVHMISQKERKRGRAHDFSKKGKHMHHSQVCMHHLTHEIYSLYKRRQNQPVKT